MSNYLKAMYACLFLLCSSVANAQINCAEGDCDCLNREIAQAQIIARQNDQAKIDTYYGTIARRSLDIKALCLDQIAAINLSGLGVFTPIVIRAAQSACSRFSNAANTVLQQVNPALPNLTPVPNMPTSVPQSLSVLDTLRCMIGSC